MKAAEIRELSTEELMKKEAELREDSFRLRFKLSTGELEDTSKNLNKLARILLVFKTILAERRKQEVANGK